jgi:hypothetical protein
VKGIKRNLLPLAAHHKILYSVQTLGETVSCTTKNNGVKSVEEVFGRQTWKPENLATGSGRRSKEEHMVMVWGEELNSQAHRNK